MGLNDCGLPHARTFSTSFWKRPSSSLSLAGMLHRNIRNTVLIFGIFRSFEVIWIQDDPESDTTELSVDIRDGSRAYEKLRYIPWVLVFCVSLFIISSEKELSQIFVNQGIDVVVVVLAIVGSLLPV